MKNIQIPEALFCHIVKYFILQEDDAETVNFIKKGINDKLEAITRHELYSKYKTAPTPDQQEQARKEYLNRIGVPESFRWESQA